MADWSNLPTDILLLISKRLPYVEDVLSLCAVCKSWNSVLSLLPPRHPWLMLADESHDHDSTIRRRFHSLLTSEKHEIELPEAAQRKCIGTSYGWLVTVGYDLNINLLHPFSREQISLPSMLTFQGLYKPDGTFLYQDQIDDFLTKVVLSRNPRGIGHNDDCVVVAIYGSSQGLTFARPGDEGWTIIAVTSKLFQDVVYCNGSFYAVNVSGELFVCDIDSEHGPVATRIALGRQYGMFYPWYHHNYIVESLGDVLLVSPTRGCREFSVIDGFSIRRLDRTIGFSIFRLEKLIQDEEDKKWYYTWTKTKDLGGRAIFVGSNVSVSLSSSEDNGVKPNCIYFSEHAVEPADILNWRTRDTGIFDVENDSIELHSGANFPNSLAPPVWYLHSPFHFIK